MINTLTLILIEELGTDLIFFSVGKGVAKVVINQGTFYGKHLNEALNKAIEDRRR